MIKALPSSQSDEQDVPYDVDFLFTNIPLQETIDYIIHKIYNEKFLKSISKKAHIQVIAVKIENRLYNPIQSMPYKQIDGFAMRGS